ncbi:MAG: helix-turn-helix domain-containing protein [Tolypothrix carrinoi HA7290-LM1]|jgi:transposase-like protein|nr:helix-turn-helix domain-containing protein [Tolypothrix carrinoi HA7290-LM1]
MPGPKATSVKITDIEKKALVHVLTTGNKLVATKAQVLLRSQAEETTAKISREMGISPSSVVKWRKAWNSHTTVAESWVEAIEKIEETLGAGMGRPKKCKQPQINKIIEIGTRRERGDRSRHAYNELIATEAVSKGIVSDISPRSIGRLLEQYERETAGA